MWIRSDLKMKAKQSFKKNYWVAVVVSLILLLSWRQEDHQETMIKII